MNYKLASIGWALVLLPILAAMGQHPEKEPFSGIATPINDFSMELFDILANNTDGNFVSSPLSVYTLLSMVVPGSSSTTLNQIVAALKTEKMEGNDFFEEIKKLIERLNKSEIAKFNLANKIYVSENKKIEQTYQNDLKKYYNETAESIDFSKSNDTSSVINNWIKQQTDNKIQNIVKSDDFDSQTNLVLVSTLYFKNTWMNKFLTEFRKFAWHGELENVLAVYSKFYFPYKNSENLKAEIIEIPYTSYGDNLAVSMVVVLPNVGVTLNDVMTNLKKYGLENLKNEERTYLEIRLPKFKVSSTFDLSSSLRKLNINNMFDNADLTPMISTKTLDMYVNKMIQKVKIDLTESGTGVPTTKIYNANQYRAPRKIVSADRPFFMFIRAEELILFAGRIVNPREI